MNRVRMHRSVNFLLSMAMASSMMSASALAKATPHVLGVCAMVNVLMSGQADLSPVINANTYFHFGRSSHAADVEPMDVNTAEVKIIRRPKHGSLEGNPLWAYARYLPNDGYRGRDAVVLRVQDKGQTVEIRYHIMVVEDMGAKPSDDARCKSDIWKIF